MEIAFRSDVGKRRQNNQDYAGYFSNQAKMTLAVLCDGIGGHNAGDVASEMAVSHLGNAWEDTKLDDTEEIAKWLLTHIGKENKRIVEKSQQYSDLEGMGTTLVAAVMVKDEFVIANIGDSRGYHYTNRRLKQITEDHSLVNELLKSGEISSEVALNHPSRNALTRSLGVSEEIDIDITILPVSSEDQLLLCSDGLTNMVTDEEIEKILSDSDKSQQKVDDLIALANERGGYDNITALLVYFSDRKEGNE